MAELSGVSGPRYRRPVDQDYSRELHSGKMATNTTGSGVISQFGNDLVEGGWLKREEPRIGEKRTRKFEKQHKDPKTVVVAGRTFKEERALKRLRTS